MRSPEPGVPLAPYTTLGVGGPAEWLAVASSADDIGAACDWAADRGVPVTILGGGSNVVVADHGVPGLVLHVALRGVTMTARGDDVVVTAAAGEVWDDVVARVVADGLAGVECLSGIPGLVGGTPIQNVGAYGQDVSQTIDDVTVFDRERRSVHVVRGEACGFGYRRSRFKASEAGRFVVCSVSFRLTRRVMPPSYPDLVAHMAAERLSPSSVADVRRAVLAVRRTKGMVLDAADSDTRSVGSFFTNPVIPVSALDEIARRAGVRPPSFAAGEDAVKVPAAWLIERAGFHRGFAQGAAALSTKHPLAIVNRGGATAREVVALAAAVARGVETRFGVRLAPEPIFLGFGTDEDVAYLRAGAGAHVQV